MSVGSVCWLGLMCRCVCGVSVLAGTDVSVCLWSQCVGWD